MESKEAIVYLNGQFVPESEAKVSVLDRGFNGGEGVYEVTRSFGHKLFKLKEHIDRLYRSLRYTRIDCGIAPEEMQRLSIEVFERNRHFLGREDDYAVWQVISRGVQQASVGQKASGKATVTIFCIPVAFDNFANYFLEGQILVTPSTRRTPPQCLEAKAKITNKMNHIVAMHEAKMVNPQATPLMLDIYGNIAETHLGNFFFVSGGKLFTPSDKNVLGGITRSTLFDLAAGMGLKVVEGDFTPYDVYNADEAFTASTSPTISPAKSLNGVAIGTKVPGPVTVSLIKAWNKMVGIDIVGQALSHVTEPGKQRALGRWAELANA
jgi:branched-chain amino acid aminotransferase